MTTASICTIGDEILIGQIIDTNSSHIASALNDAGVRVREMRSIGDDRRAIISTISELATVDNVVIITGGLGPTKDDITKNALAEMSGADSTYTHQGQLKIIHEILHSRGLDVLDINIAQADVPNTAEVILNRFGTAPIMVFRLPEERFGREVSVYSLPGVPYEALGAIPDVIDDIRRHFRLEAISHRTVMTFGLAESALSKRIEKWEDALPPNAHLAYLPNPLTGVRLRLSIYGGDDRANNAEIDGLIAQLKDIIPEYIYSYTDDTLEKCIGRLLESNRKTLSVAESCTGGKISSLITSVPGCSGYYLGSVTSYSTEVKKNVLGVSGETLEKYGAVSSECAAEMAAGVRRLTGSDFAVATTGNAGPDASEDKPVGLVWVGVASEKGVCTASFRYRNDRLRNIERFTAAALHQLLVKIVDETN